LHTITTAAPFESSRMMFTHSAKVYEAFEVSDIQINI